MCGHSAPPPPEVMIAMIAREAQVTQGRDEGRAGMHWTKRRHRRSGKQGKQRVQRLP
jgi:hypothetical protein